MANMGKEFKPPRKNDLRRWRVIELLYQRGYRWETTLERIEVVHDGHRYGYTQPRFLSPHARTMREVKADYQQPEPLQYNGMPEGVANFIARTSRYLRERN